MRKRFVELELLLKDDEFEGRLPPLGGRTTHSTLDLLLRWKVDETSWRTRGGEGEREREGYMRAMNLTI